MGNPRTTTSSFSGFAARTPAAAPAAAPRPAPAVAPAPAQVRQPAAAPAAAPVRQPVAPAARTLAAPAPAPVAAPARQPARPLVAAPTGDEIPHLDQAPQQPEAEAEASDANAEVVTEAPAAPAPAPKATRSKKALSLAQPPAPAAPAAEEPALPEGYGDDKPIMVRADSLPLFGQVTGEISQSDLRIPRLSLIHGVGDLFKDFPKNVGDFVLNKECLLLVNPDIGGQPLELTIVSAKKFWRENLPRERRDDLPRQFDTAAEVLESGESIEWLDDPNNPGKRLAPSFDPALLCIVLIKCPADILGTVDESHFPVETPWGDKYAQALFQIHASAYRAIGKKILTEASSSLSRRGLPYGRWKLASRLNTGGKDAFQEPTLVRNGLNTDEEVTFFRDEVFGGGTPDAGQ